MKMSPAWKQSALYGIVCAVFGGAVYFLIALFSDEKLGILPAICIGLLFWGSVGVIIGYFNPPRRSSSQLSPDANEDKPRLTIWRLIGQALYRTLVGALVGDLVASLVLALQLGCAIVFYGDIETALKDSGQATFIVSCCFFAAGMGALTSAQMFAWIRGAEKILSVIWASTLGIWFGVVAGLMPFFFIQSLLALRAAQICLAGAFGGVIAALFAVAWVNRKRNRSLTAAQSGTES